MEINIERKNFFAFIWHAIFLAFASSFIEINTVVPSLILKAGGSEFIVGLVTGITVGTPLIAQLLFASLLVSKPLKKPYLLIGIYLRISSLFLIALVLSVHFTNKFVLLFTILGLTIFSFSGVFAGVSYTDLLGKSISKENLRKFMSTRQILRSIFALTGAFTAKIVLNAFGYPVNYAVMFYISSFSLFIASIGFWLIKEEKISFHKKFPSFINVFKNIPKYLLNDKNLLNYVIFNNLTGFGLIIIPFYVTLAKNSFALDNKIVGNFLFLQMFGIILASFLWKKLLHNKGFKNVLKYCIMIGSITPILALILSNFSSKIYSIVFLTSGFTLSARQMSFEGLLIEISNSENRALYVGISGALNIVTAILPLIIGIILKITGYEIIFLSVSVFIVLSLTFLNRIEEK
ncbi:MFS transporter [Thermosipho globiformans]|uniref:MFS transporter n=1 Tax=Thermosipho globiformans TaxID=380685 RepID=UPI001F49744C|nr:MFS transporter [Thermosipho globiformans]